MVGPDLTRNVDEFTRVDNLDIKTTEKSRETVEIVSEVERVVSLPCTTLAHNKKAIVAQG